MSIIWVILAVDCTKVVLQFIKLPKVKEEGELNRFRIEATGRVQAEIDELLRNKESLISEVKGLETRKQQALIPLESEWEQLRQAQSKFNSEKQLYSSLRIY